MDSDNIQILVDQTPPGETLTLIAGEYKGPLVIRNPIVIEGSFQDKKIRSTIWNQAGPVIRIECGNVKLNNIHIEVTMSDCVSNVDADVAISSESSFQQVELDNVTVRGRILGFETETGDWLLPKSSLDLGYISPKRNNRFILKLYVPVPCQITTQISGLTLKPNCLKVGLNEIELEIKDICKDCLIHGNIQVRSSFVYRTIEVIARTPIDDSIDCVDGTLIWEPDNIPTDKPEEPIPPEPIPDDPIKQRVTDPSDSGLTPNNTPQLDGDAIKVGNDKGVKVIDPIPPDVQVEKIKKEQKIIYRPQKVNVSEGIWANPVNVSDDTCASIPVQVTKNQEQSTNIFISNDKTDEPEYKADVQESTVKQPKSKPPVPPKKTTSIPSDIFSQPLINQVTTEETNVDSIKNEEARQVDEESSSIDDIEERKIVPKTNIRKSNGLGKAFSSNEE